MPKEDWIKLMNSLNGSKLMKKQDEQLLFLTHPESSSQVISVAGMTRLKNGTTAQVVDENDCDENFETGLLEISKVFNRRQMELKDCNSRIRSTVHLLKQTARVDLYRERIQERAKLEVSSSQKHHDYFVETYSKVKSRFSLEDAKEYELYHSRIDTKSLNFMPLNVGRPPNAHSTKAPVGSPDFKPLEIPRHLKPKLNSPVKRIAKIEEETQEATDGSPILISRDVNGQIRVHVDYVRLDKAKAELSDEQNLQFQENFNVTQFRSVKKQFSSPERKAKVDKGRSFSDQIEAKKMSISHQAEETKFLQQSPERAQSLKSFASEERNQIDDYKPEKDSPGKGQTRGSNQFTLIGAKYPAPTVENAIAAERYAISLPEKAESSASKTSHEDSLKSIEKTKDSEVDSEIDENSNTPRLNSDTSNSSDKTIEPSVETDSDSKEKVSDETLNEVLKSDVLHLSEAPADEKNFTLRNCEDTELVNFSSSDQTNFFSNVKNDLVTETKSTAPHVSTIEINNDLIATNTDVFGAFGNNEKDSKKEKSNIKVDNCTNERNFESNSTISRPKQVSEGKLIRSDSDTDNKTQQVSNSETENETLQQEAESCDKSELENETKDHEEFDVQKTAEQPDKKSRVATDHKMTTRRKSRTLSSVKISGPKGDRRHVVVDITGTYVTSNVPTTLKNKAPANRETLPNIIARPKPKVSVPEPKMSVENLRKTILSSGEERNKNTPAQDKVSPDRLMKSNSTLSTEQNRAPTPSCAEKFVTEERSFSRKQTNEMGNRNPTDAIAKTASNSKLSNGTLSNASSQVLTRRSIHFDRTVRSSSRSPVKQPKAEIRKEKVQVSSKMVGDRKDSNSGQIKGKINSENINHATKLHQQPKQAETEFEKSQLQKPVANGQPKLAVSSNAKSDCVNEIDYTDQTDVTNSTSSKTTLDIIASETKDSRKGNSNNLRLPRLESATSSISLLSCDTLVDTAEVRPNLDSNQTVSEKRDDKILSQRREIVHAKTPIATPVSAKTPKIAMVKVSSSISESKPKQQHLNPTNVNSDIKSISRQSSQCVSRPLKELDDPKSEDVPRVSTNTTKMRQPLLKAKNNKVVQLHNNPISELNRSVDCDVAPNIKHVQSEHEVKITESEKVNSGSLLFFDQRLLIDDDSQQGSSDVSKDASLHFDMNSEKNSTVEDTPRNGESVSNIEFGIGPSSEAPRSVMQNGPVSVHNDRNSVKSNVKSKDKMRSSQKYETGKPATRSSSDQAQDNGNRKLKTEATSVEPNTSKNAIVNQPPFSRALKTAAVVKKEPLKLSGQDSNISTEAKLTTNPRPISGQKRRKISATEPLKEDPPKKVRSLVHDQTQKPWRNAMAKPLGASNDGRSEETVTTSSKESSQISLKRSKSGRSVDSSIKTEVSKNTAEFNDGRDEDNVSSDAEVQSTITEETRKSYWSTIYNFLFQRKSNNLKSLNQNSVTLNREMTKIEEEHDESKEREKIPNEKHKKQSFAGTQISEKSSEEQSQSAGAPSVVRRIIKSKDTVEKKETTSHSRGASDSQTQIKPDQEKPNRKLTMTNSTASDGQDSDTKPEHKNINRKLSIKKATGSESQATNMKSEQKIEEPKLSVAISNVSDHQIQSAKPDQEKTKQKLNYASSALSNGQVQNAKPRREEPHRKQDITNSTAPEGQVPGVKPEQEKLNRKVSRTNSSVSRSIIAAASSDPSSKTIPYNSDTVNKSEAQTLQTTKPKKKVKETKKVEPVTEPAEVVPEVHPNMMKIEDDVEPPKQEKKRSFWDKVKSAVFGDAIEDDSGDEDEDISIPDVSSNGEAEFRPRQIRINIIQAVQPSNVSEERVRFFNMDFNYDPQFTYQHPCPPDVLQRYSEPCSKYLKVAENILNNMLRNYGTYDNFEQKNLGDEMKRYELVSYVDAYCSREGIKPHDIMINISSDLLSTASMGKLNNYGVLSLKLGSIYKGTIEGILRHELGTHYMRRFNNNLQPWSDDRDRHKYRMLPMNPTEEGLASLHSVILRPQPMLYKIALLYYTVCLASMMSFSDLFKTLGSVLRNPHRRWEFCMRAKRGQIDTSQPGCFIKDQVYLTGAIDILKHRKEIDFKALVQLGKVAFEDVNRLKKLANKDEVFIVPSFMHDREEYVNRLEYIMTKNGLRDSDFEALSNTGDEDESDQTKSRSRFDM